MGTTPHSPPGPLPPRRSPVTGVRLGGFMFVLVLVPARMVLAMLIGLVITRLGHARRSAIVLVHGRRGRAPPASSALSVSVPRPGPPTTFPINVGVPEGNCFGCFLDSDWLSATRYPFRLRLA